MPDIEHSIRIMADPGLIWTALTTRSGVISWWNIGHTEIDGDPGVRGSFRFQSRGVSIRLTVEELTYPARIRWRPVEANAPGGWIGTEISFDLTADGFGTRVNFAHRGFAEDSDGFRRVTTGWAQYLQNLKRRIETPAE